jgi:hypothetical protein
MMQVCLFYSLPGSTKSQLDGRIKRKAKSKAFGEEYINF